MSATCSSTAQTGQSADASSDSVHGFNSQDWYQEKIESIPDNERELLEQYSGLKPDEVTPHVVAVRDKGFAIYDGYACIGQFRFLSFQMKEFQFYEEVMERLQKGATFCDAGCCFGQELRWLVHKGIPSEHLYGFDLEDGFIELGYELFRDREVLKATFASGNILEDPTSAEGRRLSKFVDSMDIIFCSSFLHCFDWDDMVVAAKRLISFTRPRAGSLIIGKQLGSGSPGSYKMSTSTGTMFRHDPGSMRKMWEEAGQATGTRWTVDAEFYDGLELKSNMKQKWADKDQSMMWFKATRMSD